MASRTTYSTLDFIYMAESSLISMRKEFRTHKNGTRQRQRFEYHVFAFSQIVYALFENLKTQYPRSSRACASFFRGPANTPVRILFRAANDWKHEAFVITRRYVASNKNLAVDGRVLVHICEQALADIQVFWAVDLEHVDERDFSDEYADSVDHH